MDASARLLAIALEKDLLERHGPLIADDALRAALGYRTMEAFRQSLVRKTVPVPILTFENRRGKFALVKDVAQWLAEQRTVAAKMSTVSAGASAPRNPVIDQEGEPS